MKKHFLFIFLLVGVFCNLHSLEMDTKDVIAIVNELDSLLLIDDLTKEQVSEIQNSIAKIKNIIKKEENIYEFSRIYTDLEFESIIFTIKENWPYKTQRIFLQRLTYSSYFTMNQIKNIITIFEFMDDKKDASKLLLPRVIDPENVNVIYDIFWTIGDKDFINSLIPIRK